jgi:hypothetical protein
VLPLAGQTCPCMHACDHSCDRQQIPHSSKLTTLCRSARAASRSLVLIFIQGYRRTAEAACIMSRRSSIIAAAAIAAALRPTGCDSAYVGARPHGVTRYTRQAQSDGMGGMGMGSRSDRPSLPDDALSQSPDGTEVSTASMSARSPQKNPIASP